MSKLSTLQADNVRLNALLTEASAKNEKNAEAIRRCDDLQIRLFMLRSIVNAQATAAKKALDSGLSDEKTECLFTAILQVATDTQILLKKAMNTDEDLLQYAIRKLQS